MQQCFGVSKGRNGKGDNIELEKIMMRVKQRENFKEF